MLQETTTLNFPIDYSALVLLPETSFDLTEAVKIPPTSFPANSYLFSKMEGTDVAEAGAIMFDGDSIDPFQVNWIDLGFYLASHPREKL